MVFCPRDLGQKCVCTYCVCVHVCVCACMYVCVAVFASSLPLLCLLE